MKRTMMPMMALIVVFCCVATGVAEALAQKTVEQAQVEEVDWSVGEVLKTLREEGLARNTLVVFTSDNGPAGKLFLSGELYNLKANSRPVGISPNSRTLVPRPGIDGEEGSLPTLSLQGKRK